MSEDPPGVDIPEVEVDAAKIYAEAPQIQGPPGPADFEQASQLAKSKKKQLIIADALYAARAGAGALAITEAEKKQHIEAHVEEKQAHAKTAEKAEEARYDLDTGLLTKRGFADDTKKKLAQIDRIKDFEDKRSHSFNDAVIVVFDVKGLKEINDNVSHEAGDQLLINVAELVKSVVRGDDGDVVGRIGGDEFAVAVFYDSGTITPPNMIKKIYERIDIAIREAVANGTITGLKWNSTIYSYRKTVKQLLHEADTTYKLHGDRVQHYPSRQEMPDRDEEAEDRDIETAA